MTSIGQIALISCLIFQSNAIFSQCIDTYINNRFGIEICKNEKWEIKEQLPYIIIKSNGINVSIYAEKTTSDLTPQQIWQVAYQNDKNENRDLVIKKQEHLTIDSIQAYFGITYSPPIKTDSKTRTASFNIQAVFLYNGMKYVINNNCYSNDCKLNEKLVHEIISNLILIKEEPLVLTNDEIDRINIFGNNLYTAFKTNELENFQKLLINKEILIEGLKTNMKDEEMKLRFIKTIEKNWEEFYNLYIVKNEESFIALSENAKKLKIKWSKIEFVNFEYVPHSGIPNMKSFSGTLNFKYSDKTYAIIIKDIILLKDGWFIIEFKDKYLLQKQKTN